MKQRIGTIEEFISEEISEKISKEKPLYLKDEYEQALKRGNKEYAKGYIKGLEDGYIKHKYEDKYKKLR